MKKKKKILCKKKLIICYRTMWNAIPACNNILVMVFSQAKSKLSWKIRRDQFYLPHRYGFTITFCYSSIYCPKMKIFLSTWIIIKKFKFKLCCNSDKNIITIPLMKTVCEKCYFGRKVLIIRTYHKIFYSFSVKIVSRFNFIEAKVSLSQFIYLL